MATTHRGTPRRAIGLCVDPLGGRLALAVLDVQGQCLWRRLAHVGGTTFAFPDDLRCDFAAIIDDDAVPASRLADVSARVAEFEAESLHWFLHSVPALAGADAEPLLVATCDPCVRHAPGRPWQSVLSLGDPARLAELTGLNVLDACEARHVAAGGDPHALDNVALWLLLHSAKRDRVFLEFARVLRVVLLPAGCEPSAVGRVAVRTIELPAESAAAKRTLSNLAWIVIDVLGRLVPQSPNPLQLLVRSEAEDCQPLVDEIVRIAPFIEPLDWHHLYVSTDWLDAAITAGMAHLFLDHFPQASTAGEVMRPRRLLGRLTPGSMVNWHRLLGHLAATLPDSVPLRAAI